MTQDGPNSPKPSKSPPSSPNQRRSSSVNSQYAQAFRYHSIAGSAGSGSTAGGSSPGKAKSTKPLGPRSPPRADSLPTGASSSSSSSRRERAGSSRTTFITSPVAPDAARLVSPPLSSPPKRVKSPARIDDNEASLIDIDMDAPHAPWRPPEAVIEPLEERPPGYVPGVVEEHLDEDDVPASPIVADRHLTNSRVDSWQAEVKPYTGDDMDIDMSVMPIERPQIGPGITPRRLLQNIHPHDVYQPHIDSLPVFTPKPPPPPPPLSPSTSTAQQPAISPSAPNRPLEPDMAKRYSLSEVWEAAPGGVEKHREWFFCPSCWAWIHVYSGSGVPEIPDMDSWENTVRSELAAGRSYVSIKEGDEDSLIAARQERHAEWAKWNDIQISRGQAAEHADHLHVFSHLLHPTRADRIARMEVDDPAHNAFPHVEMDLEDLRPYTTFPPAPPRTRPKLYFSCASGTWFVVDDVAVPGQLPRGLVLRFEDEKRNNPRPGATGQECVADAWSLLSEILGNALFKGQRGWIRLSGAKFQRKLGMSEVISLILYHIGLGCQQDESGYRVGPFYEKPGTEGSTAVRADHVHKMDRYMLRTWLEIETYLRAFTKRNNIPQPINHISVGTLEDNLWDFGGHRKTFNGYSDSLRADLEMLGVAKRDTALTVAAAYDLQCGCDEKNRPGYFSALEKLAEDIVPGKEHLQMKVATERSLGRISLDDIREAYARIGYNVEHASTIGVEPEHAPEEYILELHKTAVNAAKTSVEKGELSRALGMIGQQRGSEVMKKLAETGGTMMSVQDAYDALSCPMDAVDEGIIMQYELAVAEYPGKLDHYRTCLELISEAPENERPGIKTFLSTGTLGPSAPARNDIPVGLQNIGYLNSILQYLYSIKPLRDAVIQFEQDVSVATPPVKPEVERSKRFVRQLRLLFLQLYKCDSSSVRPDEELAYLAITRPEVDAIVEPAPDTVKPGPITLDDIPDMPSPSLSSIGSEKTAARSSSPVAGAGAVAETRGTMDSVDSPGVTPVQTKFNQTVLGKRASQDRDSTSSSSGEERTRIKSEQRVDEAELVESPFMENAPDATLNEKDRNRDQDKDKESGSDDFELVPRPRNQDSPLAVTDLEQLRLRSVPPDTESVLAPTEVDADEEKRSAGDDADMSSALVLDTDTKIEKEKEEHVPIYSPPSVPPPLPARPIARRASTLASGLEFGLQQDSAEVLINVLSQLELAFEVAKEGEEKQNLISDLFSCKYRQQMFVQTPEGTEEGRTPVESVFVHPIIGVEEEGKDLSDCLAELYLRGSEIEYEGKKGYIVDLMERFPPLLYIQMRRSQFDLTTGRERKTNTHIPFGQTLSMDRYLSSGDPVKREKSMGITREMTRLRGNLHQLQDRKPLSIPDTFDHVKSALGQITDMPELDITSDFLEALGREQVAAKQDIERLQRKLVDRKLELDQLWADDHSYEYELVSVFMHRGKTSGAGHYWTYQAHLPDHSDRFFKYNDELVTEVPASEVLEDRTGSDANPALLCYVRKSMNLVETLHREVLDNPEQRGQQDVDVDKDKDEGEVADALMADDTTDGMEVDEDSSRTLVDVGTEESTAARVPLSVSKEERTGAQKEEEEDLLL